MEFRDKIIQGDALVQLRNIPSGIVDCCVTSPPYWGLRSYDVDGQLGHEQHYRDFVAKLVEVFVEVRRVLKPTGTCWVNLGDTYGTQSGAMRDGKFGKKNTNNQVYDQPDVGQHKCLLMIPERFSVGMVDSGWVLRNQIIWHKPNQMPSSATDRFTVDFEKIFFFVKEAKGYYFEQQLEPYLTPMDRWGGEKLVASGVSTWDKGTGQKSYRNRDMRPNPEGRNMRTVWSVNTTASPEAHFAVYPEMLMKRIITAGCPVGGLVLDPFMGCFSNDTEVLTNKGWMLFKDVDGERVCSLNPCNNHIEFVDYIKKQQYYYDGKMYHTLGRSVDHLVTPNHKIYAKEYHRDNFKLEEQQFFKYRTFHFLNQGINGSEMDYDKNILKLIGFWLGDGYIVRQQNKKNVLSYRFNLSKQRKIDYLTGVLKDIGVKYRKWEGDERVTFSVLKSDLDLGVDGNTFTKRVPSFVFALNKASVESLLDGLFNSDGCNNQYYSSNRNLANDVQVLALLSEKSAIFRSRKRDMSSSEFIKTNDILEVFEVGFHLSGKKLKLSSDNVKKVDYSGFVHDVTLEKNHILYVRRNGKPVWSGNSGTTAVVAKKLDRDYLGIDLNPKYVEMAKQRVLNEIGLFL